jgi:hypothetical protein
MGGMPLLFTIALGGRVKCEVGLLWLLHGAM